jgi:hypothetical protein
MYISTIPTSTSTTDDFAADAGQMHSLMGLGYVLFPARSLFEEIN